MASYRFNVGVGWVVVGIDVDVDVVDDAASFVGWTAEEVELDMTDWISDEWWCSRVGGITVPLEQMISIIQESRCDGGRGAPNPDFGLSARRLMRMTRT